VDDNYKILRKQLTTDAPTFDSAVAMMRAFELNEENDVDIIAASKGGKKQNGIHMRRM
jgi:hypothetical protein